MQIPAKPPFRAAVLTSGLVTEAQLNEALAALASDSGGSGTAQGARQPAAGDEATAGTAPENKAPQITDKQLAAALVERGWLNRWQADQLLLGRARFTLGPYRVIDSIGQGGMGQVFKAEHVLMGRVVAVKVLPRHKSTPEAIASFMREIRAQAQLDHENLVRALDAGHDGNVHYLVTEYVPGTDLRRLVRRHGRLDMQAAAGIIAQAARGLAHAHSKGLIHRDVKPGNILVTPEGRAKVSDLGLVDFLDAEMESEGRRGRIVGTADYLSPEQIRTPDQLSPASDVYGLGCTLYYAVTGKVPFPGGTTRDKLHCHLNHQPFDPRRLNPDLAEPFVDVIADMMAKNVADRIPTADAVAERLAPWLDASSVRVRASVATLLPPPLPKAVALPEGSATHTRPPNGPPPVVPGAPVGPRYATPPPVAVLPDTQPSFDFLSPGEHPPSDSPSQVSQSTVPVASASEETRPLFDSREIFGRVQRLSRRSLTSLGTLQRKSGLPPLLLVMVVLAALGALGCLTMILLNLR
ncbi:MAG: serine/threonine-protein kinase [Pirellulales bacterium]